MRTRALTILIAVTCVGAILVAACAPAATPAPEEPREAPEEAAPVEVEAEVEKVVVATAAAPSPEEAPAAREAVVRGAGDVLPVGRERLIIKDAEMTLLVQDTDITIDRITQVVGDLGGYIISSRIWYQEKLGDEYKYATVTMAVPAGEFEHALRRLRGLAVIVTDESASGEDVTDEYVDLESRLRNLEATRDRIREFLDKAKTVEEALDVNEELSKVEDQIEKVLGRMNYLFDRASYSTITIQIEPEVPVLTPTPTPTPTITPTPTATPTPTPWRAGDTFQRAGRTLGRTSQTLAQIAIWLVVAVLPWVALVAVVPVVVWLLVRRNRKTRPKADQRDKA